MSFLFRFFFDMCISCCYNLKFEYNLARLFKVTLGTYTISPVPHVFPRSSERRMVSSRVPGLPSRTCRSAWRGVTPCLSHFCTPNLTLTLADPAETTLLSADGSQYEITAVVFLSAGSTFMFLVVWLVCKKSTGMFTQTNVTTASVGKKPGHE